MPEPFYRNKAISKVKAKVFDPANRCIYCTNGKPPFTKEHVIPKGLGGGMILPKASCDECRDIINEIETYCMRGPFLSHRLKRGLVQHLAELGETLKMPIIIDGKRHEKEILVSEFPNYLALPTIFGPPRLLRGDPFGTMLCTSFKIWGIEEELLALHKEGNAILVDKFDLNKFGRVLAKIAHGYIAGELRLENFAPLLPAYILGKVPQQGALFLGNWGKDGMARPPGLLHQVGMGFENWGGQVVINVRIRLFAEYERTPVYHVLAGILTKPLADVLAPLGLRPLPPSA